MKNTYWEIVIKNPANDNIIERKQFECIADIHKQYSKIPEATWRNIAVGRSKVYKNFIEVEKKTRKTSEEDKEEEKPILLTFE
tara:strand:+ start:289 stop:537 length:249 start_codon:yes stop_codon:yes gene_type:complete